MARILSLGVALQEIFLIDHDDLTPTKVGESAFYGKILAGGRVDIDNLCYEVDGGGINSAITFARYGHETILMSNIARDTAGEAILSVLDQEGIDCSYINDLSRKATGTSIVLLDSNSKEHTVLTYAGASLRTSNFSENDLELIQPDWLYVSSLDGNLETISKFFEKAHEMGIKIMFCPGKKELSRTQELTELLSKVDVLALNKMEASRIVPGTVLIELLYHLNNYVSIVIITDGAMGGIAGDRKKLESYRFGVYEDINVKDTTGAGDAFSSGFLSAYADGKNLHDALLFASANATSVIKSIGANKGILTGNEKLHLMPIQKMQV